MHLRHFDDAILNTSVALVTLWSLSRDLLDRGQCGPELQHLRERPPPEHRESASVCVCGCLYVCVFECVRVCLCCLST